MHDITILFCNELQVFEFVFFEGLGGDVQVSCGPMKSSQPTLVRDSEASDIQIQTTNHEEEEETPHEDMVLVDDNEVTADDIRIDNEHLGDEEDYNHSTDMADISGGKNPNFIQHDSFHSYVDEGEKN